MRPLLLCLILVVAGCSNCVGQDLISEPVAVQMGEPTAKSLSSFRKALISQAEKSFKAGEMTRANLMRIRVASMFNGPLEKMHQACAEQVLSDGLSPSYGAIDWEKLAAFIKEMLPIILELIKLFA